MPVKRVTPPTSEGRYRGVFKNDNILGTDWNDLKSEDFYSLTTGEALPEGLSFTYVGIIIISGQVAYLKYRPRDAANDSTDYSSGVLEIFGSYTDNPVHLYGGGWGYVKCISVKANTSTSRYEIIAGFDKVGAL